MKRVALLIVGLISLFPVQAQVQIRQQPKHRYEQRLRNYFTGKVRRILLIIAQQIIY